EILRSQRVARGSSVFADHNVGSQVTQPIAAAAIRLAASSQALLQQKLPAGGEEEIRPAATTLGAFANSKAILLHSRGTLRALPSAGKGRRRPGGGGLGFFALKETVESPRERPIEQKACKKIEELQQDRSVVGAG